MRSRGFIFLGVVLIFLGAFSLLELFFDIDFSDFIFPVVLILIGLWAIFRPNFSRNGRPVDVVLFGGRKLRGAWEVKPREFWTLIGDTDFDFSLAVLPEGETVIEINYLIGDVKINIPPSFALMVSTHGALYSTNWMGTKKDFFFSGEARSTPDYASAARRVRLEVTQMIGEVKVNY